MRPLLCSAALLLVAGCDRPVVDLAPPRVEVVSPADLGVVQTDPFLTLSLRAEVFGEIDSVAVGGRATTFDPNRNVYDITVSLLAGLNRLPVEVFDAEGLRGTDTLFAFHADLRPVSAPVSGGPQPAWGAAASSLPSGAALVSGGAASSGEGRQTATTISTVGGVLSFRTIDLLEPRSQHTSTVLPDGRVLLLGGSRSVPPASRALNGTAEILDPSAGTTEAVPIRTDPDRAGGGPTSIRRSGHAARLLNTDGVSVIYLYGGVNAQGVPLSTVDVFRWDDGTLTALSPPDGASGSYPAYANPTEVPVGSRGASEGSSVVFGLADDDEAPTAFAFEWLAPTGPRYPFDLEGRTIGPLSTPRDGASALFLRGYVLVAGGTAADGRALDTFEAYVPSVDRSFRFPDSIRLRTARTDHSATLSDDGRILILGGRTAPGTALLAIEAFQLF